MGRFVFTILLLSCSTNFLFSQNWNSVFAKETEAEQLFGEKQYEKAADKFQDALKLVPKSGSLMYKVGLCYLFTDDKKHLAIDFLEKAKDMASADFDPKSIKETNAPLEALYHLGRAYQMANRLDEAKQYFLKYKQSLKPNDEFVKIVDMRIATCNNAAELMRNPITFRAKNLGESINNASSNFNAIFSGDGKTMAYTTLGKRGYEVFIAKNENGEWSKPVNISNQIKTNAKTSSLSADGTVLYLIDDFSPNSEIMVSELVNKKWSSAANIGKPINSKYKESHASISPDGKTLYFTSDRPGGMGGLDIYKSVLNAKGKWSKPENLGPRVNTEFNEETPFTTTDDKYLFFSSEGHKSMGGFDIFYAELNGNGPVTNLGYPINTTSDNQFFFPSNGINSGYTAFHNSSSLGGNDIFQIKILPLINLMGSIETTESAVSENKTDIAITIMDIESGSVVQQLTTTLANPNFSGTIIAGNYEIVAEGKGFQKFNKTFEIPEEHSKQTFSINIPLLALAKQAQIAALPEPLIIEPQVSVLEEPKAEPKRVQAFEPIAETKPEGKIEKVSKPIQPKLKEEKRGVSSNERLVLTNTPSSAQKKYTVQLMALRNPVGAEKFADVPNIAIVPGADGYYRYLVGQTESIDEAKIWQKELKEKGYSNAYVRAYPETGFTIQVMALKTPAKPNLFGNLSNLWVVQGSDGLYRYMAGSFATIDEAKAEMAKILGLGYKDVFIRKM